jgi:hypothetical protein
MKGRGTVKIKEDKKGFRNREERMKESSKTVERKKYSKSIRKKIRKSLKW